MSKQDKTERREYYRIHDEIALQINTDYSDFVNESSLFNLLNELYLLEHEAQPLLRAISEQQRTLVNYLKITNKRIDLLAQALAQNLLKDFPKPQQTTLSEGGLSFFSHQSFNQGQTLYLKMLLLPQALALQLTATVVGTRKKPDGRLKTAVTFVDLTESQRQILARHILQKQAHERRQALLEENS